VHYVTILVYNFALELSYPVMTLADFILFFV